MKLLSAYTKEKNSPPKKVTILQISFSTQDMRTDRLTSIHFEAYFTKIKWNENYLVPCLQSLLDRGLNNRHSLKGLHS